MSRAQPTSGDVSGARLTYGYKWDPTYILEGELNDPTFFIACVFDLVISLNQSVKCDVFIVSIFDDVFRGSSFTKHREGSRAYEPDRSPPYQYVSEYSL